VKRRTHLGSRRDTGSLVAVQAESLRVVACLAIRGVREDVHGMSFHEVRTVEAPRFLRSVATSADLLGMALCAIQSAAGGRGTVSRREVGRMNR
jgi:hypothetical protein